MKTSETLKQAIDALKAHCGTKGERLAIEGAIRFLFYRLINENTEQMKEAK